MPVWLLFEGLYPWAGKDRAELLPNSAVTKGSLYFCHPRDSRLAVMEGLSLAQDKGQMTTRPGFIMGMFAYGHPFLDGNGRAMLLVHAELCYRASMSLICPVLMAQMRDQMTWRVMQIRLLRKAI